MTFARRPAPLGRFNRRGLGLSGGWRPTQLSGCVLWLRADMGITTVDAAVTDPNDISTGNWTAQNLSARTASRATEDNTLGVHQVTQMSISGLQLNHLAHFRIGIPAASGGGRYVAILPNSGGDFLYVDAQAGALLTSSAGILNETYSGGVVEFDVVISAAAIAFYTSDNGARISYQGDSTHYVQLGDNGLGALITVTQRNASAWADQSGTANDFTQATSTARPLFVDTAHNGRPALRGDASDKLSIGAAVGSGSANTLLAVLTGAGAASSYMLSGADGNTCSVLHRFSGNLVEWFNGAGADRYTFANGLFAGAPHVLTVAQTNGSALQGWWDGTSSFGPVVPTTAFSGLRHVMGYAGAANASSADCAEVIVYNRVLATAERQQVERYLGARYGITVA